MSRWLPLLCLIVALALGLAWFVSFETPPEDPVDPTTDPDGTKGRELSILRQRSGSPDGISRAALVRAGGVQLIHLRPLDSKTNLNESLRLGKAVADLLGSVHVPAIPLSADQETWAQAHMNTVVLPGAGRPSSWPVDSVQFAQGRDEQTSRTLLKTLVALEAGTLKFESQAFLTENAGAVLVAEYQAEGWALEDLLTPMVIEREGKVSFLLGVLGMPIGLSGMTSEGVALAGASPGFLSTDYVSGTGPDLLTETDIILRMASSAGMDGDRSAGRMLLPFSETDYISRLSSPGILLIADRREAYRYEWRSVGSDPSRSSGLEFQPMMEGRVFASSDYQSPELKRSNNRQSPKSLTDFEEVQSFVREGRAGVRVAYLPAQERVLVNIGGKFADLRLSRMRALKWDAKGTESAQVVEAK